MAFKSEIKEGLRIALLFVGKSNNIDSAQLTQDIELERCKDLSHGDYASNIAMKYAKIFKMSPRKLADELVVSVPILPNVAAMEVAGPGFINVRLARHSLNSVLDDIVTQESEFGLSNKGEGSKVLLEFVSANPTGPLHVGHGRGAAYGDSLSRLLKANGFKVDNEYYVNDAGRQMQILALSVYLRYAQLFDADLVFPKGIYQGDYVIDIAKLIKENVEDRLFHPLASWIPEYPSEWSAEDVDAGLRDKWIDDAIVALRNQLGDSDFALVFDAGLNSVLDDIKLDLSEFGVHFDRWFSEKTLFDSGKVDETLAALEKGGFLYEKKGALWFKSEQFGDEKDRVVKRDNGITTYFASDIAYHLDKYQRGYDLMIDIFGADHHGYMARVKASLAALDLNPAQLSINLVQFAVLYKGGKKMQMSTRSGEFVTLKDLRDTVGSDAARFFYVMRKPEQHLDFDLDLAISHSKDNPFYYVEYAHARTCRVLEKAKEEGFDFKALQALEYRNRLSEVEENSIINELRRFPDVIIAAAENFAPHQVINYLRDLATSWHHFYDSGKKVLHEDDEIREARLLLTYCVRQVLRNGLEIVGVEAKEKM